MNIRKYFRVRKVLVLRTTLKEIKINVRRNLLVKSLGWAFYLYFFISAISTILLPSSSTIPHDSKMFNDSVFWTFLLQLAARLLKSSTICYCCIALVDIGKILMVKISVFLDRPCFMVLFGFMLWCSVHSWIFCYSKKGWRNVVQVVR